MMKRLFLLLIVSFIGVASNPYILIANKVEQINSPGFNAVETIIEPEIVEEPEIKKQPAISTATEVVSYVTPVVAKPSNSIMIAGKYIPIAQTSSTEIVYDSSANRYGGKFIYGHNSENVFGVLYGSWIGQTFSVTIDGVTKNYGVGDIVVYEKNQINGLLQINGHGNYMNSVANAIKKNIDGSTGQVNLSYYDLSIMTCYGTMLGGGDATHRLVLFAYEI